MIDEIWNTLQKEVGEAWEKYDGQEDWEYDLDEYGDDYEIAWNKAKQALYQYLIGLKPEKRSPPDVDASQWAQGVYQGYQEGIDQYAANIAAALKETK